MLLDKSRKRVPKISLTQILANPTQIHANFTEEVIGDHSRLICENSRFRDFFSNLTNSKKAFSLVEMLIALAILAMIVASTFTIFRSSSKSWQKGEERSERYHTARVAMGKMALEISQAVMTEKSACRFTGTQTDVKFVSFVSTTSGVFELAEIEYWLAEKERVLMRNEDVDPDYDFLTQDHSDILADNVSELNFSYYDGKNWSDTWDSTPAEGETASNLPTAVKIKITVQNKKAKESETFEVITHLKTA